MTDLDALMQYLRRSATDYAYMITGPWGSGKSHFWNQIAVPAIANDKNWTDETRPTPVYISLYSIKHLDDIPRSVLLQTRPKLAWTGKVASLLGRGAMEFANLNETANRITIEVEFPTNGWRGILRRTRGVL